jgi:hypothetical protein
MTCPFVWMRGSKRAIDNVAEQIEVAAAADAASRMDTVACAREFAQIVREEKDRRNNLKESGLKAKELQCAREAKRRQRARECELEIARAMKRDWDAWYAGNAWDACDAWDVPDAANVADAPDDPDAADGPDAADRPDAADGPDAVNIDDKTNATNTERAA